MSGLLTLCLLLISSALVLAAAATWFMARALLAPPRMGDGKALYLLKRMSPEDIGLPYKPMTFDVRDERSGRTLRMAAWWIPAAIKKSDRTVVLLHGYADAKVGASAWAPLWIEIGWNVLAIDLRAHGQSAGKSFTAGFYERYDVASIIDELRLARPDETRHVALMGISAGAAVAAAVGALYAVAGRADLSAVVLDSPFADYGEATRAHVDLLGLPRVLVKPTLWLAERLTGARFDRVRPIDLVQTITAPLLIVHSRQDPFISAARQLQMDDLARKNAKRCFVSWHADAEHVRALTTHTQEYREQLRAFITSARGSPENGEISGTVDQPL